MVLNPFSAQVRAELASPYEMHRTLARAFPDGGADARVLFRVEEMVRGQDGLVVPILIVQSRYGPEWCLEGAPDALRGYLMPRGVDGGVLQCAALDSEPPTRRPIRFRLRANPSRRDVKTGKRVALSGGDDVCRWLARKGVECGFELAGLDIEGARWNEVRRHGSTVAFRSVDYRGVLRVLDKAAFREARCNGIGPAKAFGCGLLLWEGMGP
jgi:CRISPR system Cascade subunit CasE